ncbi:branched-chain amino acid transport domain protein [Escherichia coli JB1-95]|nr:branched-chain amino acid transport domain protein [Escherichia coli JB1-95]
MVGLQAGEHVWTAAFGFLITAVGLPVLTVVALAKLAAVLTASARQSVKSLAYCWQHGRLTGRRTRLDCGIRLPHYCRWPAGINGSGAGKSWRRC